jgi:hypothetical protein
MGQSARRDCAIRPREFLNPEIRGYAKRVLALRSCVRQVVQFLDQVLGWFLFAAVAAKGVARSGSGGGRLRDRSEQLLLLLRQQRHVQVAVFLQPRLVRLDAQR